MSKNVKNALLLWPFNGILTSVMFCVGGSTETVSKCFVYESDRPKLNHLFSFWSNTKGANLADFITCEINCDELGKVKCFFPWGNNSSLWWATLPRLHQTITETSGGKAESTSELIAPTWRNWRGSVWSSVMRYRGFWLFTSDLLFELLLMGIWILATAQLGLSCNDAKLNF